MPTSVGNQSSAATTAVAFAQLGMDCVAAYSVAKQKARSTAAQTAYDKMQGHSQHCVDACQGYLQQHGHPLAKPYWSVGPNHWKAVVFGALGDAPLAWALRNNAGDRETASKRVMGNGRFGPELPALAEDLLAEAKDDLRQTQAMMCSKAPHGYAEGKL